MYVGVTRGKNQVILSRAITRRLYGGSRSNPPSRFLREIPKELLLRAGEGEGGKGQGGDQAPEVLRSRRLSNDGEAGFDTGDRVVHHRFGEGTVITVMSSGDDTKIEVAFDDHGLRLLLARYAKLQKISL